MIVLRRILLLTVKKVLHVSGQFRLVSDQLLRIGSHSQLNVICFAGTVMLIEENITLEAIEHDKNENITGTI